MQNTDNAPRPEPHAPTLAITRCEQRPREQSPRQYRDKVNAGPWVAECAALSTRLADWLDVFANTRLSTLG